jgi:hypothetical protein
VGATTKLAVFGWAVPLIPALLVIAAPSPSPVPACLPAGRSAGPPACSAMFYVQQELELAGACRRRSLGQEAALAAAASACLGFGTVIFLLWCGVYLG